jgi:hypothetical protein
LYICINKWRSNSNQSIKKKDVQNESQGVGRKREHCCHLISLIVIPIISTVRSKHVTGEV